MVGRPLISNFQHLEALRFQWNNRMHLALFHQYSHCFERFLDRVSLSGQWNWHRSMCQDRAPQAGFHSFSMFLPTLAIWTIPHPASAFGSNNYLLRGYLSQVPSFSARLLHRYQQYQKLIPSSMPCRNGISLLVELISEGQLPREISETFSPLSPSLL